MLLIVVLFVVFTTLDGVLIILLISESFEGTLFDGVMIAWGTFAGLGSARLLESSWHVKSTFKTVC